MSKRGSLAYQMQGALKGIFRPGRRRYHDREHGRDDMIRGIETMRCMVADVSQFARFIRARNPEIRILEDVTPKMAQDFIAEQIRRDNSGGYIGRVIASIRKLDVACRKARIFTASHQPLLPYEGHNSLPGFHSDLRPLPYTDKQADALITSIAEDDPAVALLLKTMRVIGLRVKEATYLMADDINVEAREVTLASNANHTKGGRPRIVKVQKTDVDFLAELRSIGEKRPDGHIFTSRSSLPKRARDRVRNAYHVLKILPLGTHGFRKTFAVNDYRSNLQAGQSDTKALLATSRQLGHNRSKVTRDSYIPPNARGQD
jgi:integrase